MINKRHNPKTNGMMLDNIINDQSTHGARIADKARAAQFNSPDLSKMYPLQVGKSTYYFSTKQKRDNFIKRNQ